MDYLKSYAGHVEEIDHIVNNIFGETLSWDSFTFMDILDCNKESLSEVDNYLSENPQLEEESRFALRFHATSLAHELVYDSLSHFGIYSTERSFSMAYSALTAIYKSLGSDYEWSHKIERAMLSIVTTATKLYLNKTGILINEAMNTPNVKRKFWDEAYASIDKTLFALQDKVLDAFPEWGFRWRSVVVSSLNTLVSNIEDLTLDSDNTLPVKDDLLLDCNGEVHYVYIGQDLEKWAEMSGCDLQVINEPVSFTSENLATRMEQVFTKYNEIRLTIEHELTRAYGLPTYISDSWYGYHLVPTIYFDLDGVSKQMSWGYYLEVYQDAKKLYEEQFGHREGGSQTDTAYFEGIVTKILKEKF